MVTYEFLPELFLRAPYYSFNRYDPERLPEVLAMEAFRNAVFLASPGFYRQLEAKGFNFARLNPKEKHTLCKYYNRMSFRPVPFGSFASFSLLAWGNGETVRLGGDETAVLHVLPDESLRVQLQDSADGLRPDTLLIKSPTLYRLGREYRFVKTQPDEKGHYQFSLDALPAEKIHQALFAGFKKGPVSAGELAALIAALSGCMLTEAQDYLAFLVRDQVLYAPGRPSVICPSGPGPVLPGPDVFWLKYKNRPFLKTGSLAAAAAELESLLPAKPQENGPCFYAALERQCESGGPGTQDQAALGAAIGVLRRLALPFSPPNLEQFREDFRARFDLEKVPLLRALDPDAGVGYGNNGISGIVMDYGALRFPEQAGKPEPLEWTPVHRLLFRLWGTAQQRGPWAPLVITEPGLAELDAYQPPVLPPPTLAVMFRKTGDHLLVEYAGSASATALAGRFSAFSPDVEKLCRRLAALEEAAHPDLVFADIGQLSDAHTDNINRRQPVYPFEIPLNVYSALPPGKQLPPEDLLVSVRSGEVILESIRLKKRVIPRLATAYNHRHNGLALFRLLGDLQYQGLQASLSFNMESLFPGLSFYPRVLFGGVILSLARWNFEAADLAALQAAQQGDELSALRRFRGEHGLPQMVSMGNTDQQLVFDLASPQEAFFFLRCLQGLKKLTLVEYLPPGRSVKTGSKPLSGQFIAFLSHPEKIYNGLAAHSLPKTAKASRDFLPGSEWLYLKLYCTPESADGILANVIWPVIRKNAPLISAWFFIRYFENGHHLRLRVRMAPEKAGLLLAALKVQLRRSGSEELIRNYQGDTYRRELERYGAALITEVETLFCAGSGLVARFAVLQESEKTGLTHLMLGVYSAYHLVACFMPGGALMLDFFKLMAARFLKGFGGDKVLKADLDREYRALKNEIGTLLEKPVPEKSLAPAFKKMLTRAAAIEKQIRQQPAAERQALLADLVHMQLNRTFRIKQRQQELMVYYFLEKYMLSLMARQNKSLQTG